MSDPVEAPATSITPTPAATPLTPDEATDLCMAAFKRAQAAAAAKGKPGWECEKVGRFAFRLAIPSTGTLEGVQAFIACVTRGMHLNVWGRNEANQLFYAAQVSLSAIRREPRRTRATEKEIPPSPPM